MAFDALGVGVTVEVSDASLLDDVRHCLPRDARERSPAVSDDRVVLTVADDGRCVLTVNGSVHERDDVNGGLIGLASHLHIHVISGARELLFVHAVGAAAGGRGIVLTGGMGIGKSTLVAALIRAGALYYTDDYAPIDARGYLHPYPMPIALRDPATGQGRDHTVESFGGSVGPVPVPIGIVGRIAYRAGGGLRLERISPGDGSLLLLEHSFGVERRPALATKAAAGATADALVLAGERGDADEAAAELIRLARDLPSPQQG